MSVSTQVPTTPARARFAQLIRKLGPTMGKSADNPFFKSKYLPLPQMLLELRPFLDEADLVLY
jgi:hypothetical protein